MKGHRSIVTVQGHTVGEAERRMTPTGKYVTSFTLGVGGNREKHIDGVFIRCLAWDENAELVEKAITRAGQAVTAVGRLSQKARDKDGKIYINNDLNLNLLFVQLDASDTELTEVELVRRDAVVPAAASQKGGNGAEVGEGDEVPFPDKKDKVKAPAAKSK
jgi:single-stranded DNA-binding protein